LSPVVCPAVPYFFFFFHKRHDFREKLIIGHKMRVLIFSKSLAHIIFYSKKNQASYDQNVC
jgi:hypothetical protein